jgi:hypothetical protein
MSTPEDELGPVLARIAGTDIYRGNAFRVAGLPSDAGTAEIRRSREEALLLSGLARPASGGGRRRDDSAPAESASVRAAYETLRDPVARLTHELLWPARSPDPDRPWTARHEEAVRVHRDAVEGEAGGPYPPGSARAARLDELWVRGLAAWAEVLATRDFWDHAKGRVAEIADPRLTTGTVRRLRERLPRHIASVTADLAVLAVSLSAPEAAEAAGAADRDGTRAAGRLVALLRESPLPAEAVSDALRTAVRAAERTLRDACSTAHAAVSAREGAGDTAGRALLERAAEPLRVVRALLGAEDAVATALEESVAVALNVCAVGHFNGNGTARTAQDLLAAAEPLAHVRRTRELIAENRAVVSRSRAAVPTGPAPDLPTALRRMCDAGKVERAAGYLRAMAAAIGYRNIELAKELRATAADRRSVAAPVRGEPFLGSVLGCGVRAQRSPGPDADGARWATYVVALLYVPLLPLATYVMDDRGVHAKVPLTFFARWARRGLFMTAPLVAAFAVFGALPGLGVTVGAVVGVMSAYTGRRKHRVETWLAWERAR